MKIDIRHNFKDVQKSLDNMQAEVRDRALASAVNKTVDQAKTQMIRQITAEYMVSAAYVRERLKVKRASFRQGQFLIQAVLDGSGNKPSANIIAFIEKSVSMAQAKKRQKAGTLKQLFVKVKRGGPAKPLGPAFIGNKGRTVFVREGKDRLPIKPVQTINIRQMFNQRKINATVVRMMTEKFPELFARESKFFLDKFNKR